MINQIIPIVEFGVKTDTSVEFLTVPAGDFSACFIDFVDNTGEDLESDTHLPDHVLLVIFQELGLLFHWGCQL